MIILLTWSHEAALPVLCLPVDEEVPAIDGGFLAQPAQGEGLVGGGDLARDAVTGGLLADGVTPHTWEIV